jgi:DNA-binding transcriptional LysR family regulator
LAENRHQRRGVDTNRFSFDQPCGPEALQHPRKDRPMRLERDQAPSPRNRRMVRWVVFQADAQEIPQRQRIGRTPSDAALRVNAFEVPDQQQPEVDAGRQARATHRLRVEAGALAFDEIIESVLAQQLIQAPVEWMTGRRRQLRRCDPHRWLAVTPWHKELEHRQFALDRMVLAVPKGHPLTKRQRIRLRDLRNMPFIWFHRRVNPAFYDQMMEACARGGLIAPHVVQEATDRDTVLGCVQCQIGIAWLTESTRWHCPRGVVLLPVVDMDVRLPFNVIWKKDNASLLLQKFLAQVQASQQ